MTVLEIFNSFRFSEERFSNHETLNKNLNDIEYKFLILFLKFIKVVGLFHIFSYLAQREITKIGLEDISVCHMVLTNNQFNAAIFLKNKGVDMPLVNFGRFRKGADINISRRLLVFSIFLDITRLAEVLSFDKLSFVARTNNLRLIELVGLLNILERFSRLKLVLKYNDHGPHSTLIYDYCRKFNITTVYAQHASIGNYSPNVLYHDINFLWSQSALDRYVVNSKSPKVLVGADFRLSKFFGLQESNEGKLLIATNKLDNLERVDCLINSLKEAMPKVTVVLRPHPGDNRDHGALEKYISKNREKLITDISECKWVLANESNIALEAITAGRLFYKCAFLSEAIDNYGFLRGGLLKKEFFSIEELLDSILMEEITYRPEMLEYFTGDIDNIDNAINRLKDYINQLE